MINSETNGVFNNLLNYIESKFKINFRKKSEDKDKELFESFQLMFLIEEYTIDTEDNYKIQLFRILLKDDTNKIPGRPVLFQHGLFDSSDGWIANYEKNCLPYILLKKGFDVWMANSRGNKHSKLLEQEAGKDPSKNSGYWDYSFHEMGMFDTPANIEKILSINKEYQDVIYFGHSQGGSSILAGMCEKKEYYKSKLKAVVLLAPASRIDNYDSNFLTFMRDVGLEEKLHIRNIFEILPHDPSMSDLSIKIGKLYPTMHYAMLEFTSDENSWMNCPERIKVFMAHYPSGSSLKSLVHFKQLIDAKSFQHFDYGAEENLKRYGTPNPKVYDIKSIEGIPIILCGGLNDKLTHIDDIRWLKTQLKEKCLFSYYEFEYMGHVSFLINNDITWFNFVLRDLYKILDKENIDKENVDKEEKIKSIEGHFRKVSKRGSDVGISVDIK